MKPLLEAVEASKRFDVRERGRRRTVHALDQVSIEVAHDEVLGIVGESGCGKSTLGRLLVGLHAPSSGSVRFHGAPIRRPGAAGRLQMVFQDPGSSLSPKVRIATSILEPLRGRRLDRRRSREAVDELLEQVGLPASMASRYPHEMSGGQQQRVAIARSLAAQPDLIVLDEAVSALDISTQAQILNLLRDIRESRSTSFVFISHDLNAVRYISDRVAVMYLGRVVELASSEAIGRRSLHPYSVALQSAVPTLEATNGQSNRVILEGPLPSPTAPPSGCLFRTRCPIAAPECATVSPKLESWAPNHHAACHFAGDFQPADQPTGHAGGEHR